MKDVDKIKTDRVHRTSSSRKNARRKNEQLAGGTESMASSSDKLNKGEKTNYNLVYFITSSFKSWIRTQCQLQNVTTLALAVGFALYNFYYTQSLFENFTKFSQLSDVEREVSLPTDVAFRYSFFKGMVEGSSFVEGLHRVTRDERRESPNVMVASSFHRHSLSPQVILAGAFHMVRQLAEWTDWPKRSCKTVSVPVPEDRSQSTNYRKEEHLFSQSCGGLRDPLYFYLSSVWALESLVVVLIFYLGLRFGRRKRGKNRKSVLGGIIAAGMFILLHPQRSNYEWLFPLDEKIGWICIFFQVYTTTKTVFCSVHPTWTCTVKVGVSTAFLILGWNTNAQWFLISQLLIVALLHIFGFFSRYVTSLVVFGQLTGWQWASLISLDLSFHHWSFFVYTLTSVILTIFLIEPLVDWILGKKAEKWAFFRRTILLLTLQTILISVRCDLGQMFALREDSRFPLTASLLTDPENAPISFSPDQNNWMNHMKSRFDQFKEERSNSSQIRENGVQNHPGENILWRNRDQLTEVQGKTEAKEEVDTFIGQELSEFLRLCLYSRGKVSAVAFALKYFWLIVAGLYAVFFALMAQFHSTSNYLNWKNDTFDRAPETEGKIKTKFWLPSSMVSLSSFLVGKLPSFSLAKLLQRKNSSGSTINSNNSSSWSSSLPSPLSQSSSTSSSYLAQPSGSGYSSTSFLWSSEANEYGSGEIGEEGKGALRGSFGDSPSFVCYHIGQTLFFGLFCLVLGGRWEILWLPHVCLLLSSLSDFQRSSRFLKSCPFTYAKQVHWTFVVVLLGILVASARVRSNQMHQKSRGRFEIGNPSVASSLQVLNWIRENSDDHNNNSWASGSSPHFKIAGADNLIVMLRSASNSTSTSTRSIFTCTVSHHLTIHSWANKNSGMVTTPAQDKLMKIDKGAKQSQSQLFTSAENIEEEEKEGAAGVSKIKARDPPAFGDNNDKDNSNSRSFQRKGTTRDLQREDRASQHNYAGDTSEENYNDDDHADGDNKASVPGLHEMSRSASSPSFNSLPLSKEEKDDALGTSIKKNRDGGKLKDLLSWGHLNSKSKSKSADDDGDGDADHNSSEDENSSKETIIHIGSSLLTPQEVLDLEKVYMVFSRRNSLQEFHDALLSLNITHFLLSPNMCLIDSDHVGGLSKSSHKNTMATTNSHWKKNSHRHYPSSSGELDFDFVEKVAADLTESSKETRRSMEEPSQQQEQDSCASGRFVWQWSWNWQQQKLLGDDRRSLPKACNFVQFWDSVFAATAGKDGRSDTEDEPPGAGSEETHNRKGVINTQAKYQNKAQGSLWKEEASRRRNSLDNSKERIEVENKSKEDQELDEDPSLTDIICYRLIHERNILPFTRVFQNSFFTIVSTQKTRFTQQ